MYSGSDSTESQKYPQWALNPSAYQNMGNDEVDWAALAQQWIIMKEAGPPPIPGDLGNNKLKEGGEAPMDVEDAREEMPPVWNVPQVDPWSYSTPNPNWGWNNNSWTPPPGGGAGLVKAPLLPTPPSQQGFCQFSAPPESSNDNAVPFGAAQPTIPPPLLVTPPPQAPPPPDFSSGYWTTANPKQIKPHNRRYSKVNVPRPAPPAPIISEPNISELPTLDAAKRKQLPAWIREGLEKMERDKIKQLEKEREKQEQDKYVERIKESEKEKMEILKSTMKEQRSKFESDNEQSDGDSRTGRKVDSPEPIPLTPDELMLKVRRTMTQILLQVTGQHIESICKEELERYNRKTKASEQHSSAPSGANISSKLGLSMYGGESGTSSEDEDCKKDNSDSELKDTIKKKVAEFSKTEPKASEVETRRPSNSKPSRRSFSRTPDSKDNDSQVEALQVQGRRQRRRRSSSSSSNSSSPNRKSSKYSRRSTRSSSSSGATNSVDSRSRRRRRRRSRSRSKNKKRTSAKSRRSRRSSSSSSYRRSRSRRRRRSRSYKHRSNSSGRGKRSHRH